jgi:sulfur-carrier protein
MLALFRPSQADKGAIMSIHFEIPATMRQHTNGTRAVDLEASRVDELLEQLCKTFPSLRPYIFAAPGVLSRHLNVFVNNDMIEFLQNLETPVTPRDNVTVLIGGSGG